MRSRDEYSIFSSLVQTQTSESVMYRVPFPILFSSATQRRLCHAVMMGEILCFFGF